MASTSCRTRATSETTQAELFTLGFTSGQAAELVTAAEVHGVTTTQFAVCHGEIVCTYAVIVEYDPASERPYSITESRVRVERITDGAA